MPSDMHLHLRDDAVLKTVSTFPRSLPVAYQHQSLLVW
jgi:dihydroorotase